MKINVRNLIILISSFIFIYLFLHLIQTGRFLIGHFIATEQINNQIKFDIDIWQKNPVSKEKIPRHIHQIWISSIENRDMPAKFQQASKSCQKYNQNYNYSLWTHQKILHWLTNEYSWFLPIYNNYHYDMQRIDAMKYFFLFHFGGIYIDLDVECYIKDTITSMLPKNQTNIEPEIIFHMGGEGISANTDIMAAKQYHPFFKLAINCLESANRWFYLYHLTIILSAGPTYLYGIYRRYPYKERIYFIPNDFLWGKIAGGIGGETWYGNDTKLLIFLVKNRIFLGFLFGFVLCFILFRNLKKRKFYNIYLYNYFCCNCLTRFSNFVILSWYSLFSLIISDNAGRNG